MIRGCCRAWSDRWYRSLQNRRQALWSHQPDINCHSYAARRYFSFWTGDVRLFLIWYFSRDPKINPGRVLVCGCAYVSVYASSINRCICVFVYVWKKHAFVCILKTIRIRARVHTHESCLQTYDSLCWSLPSFKVVSLARSGRKIERDLRLHDVSVQMSRQSDFWWGTTCASGETRFLFCLIGSLVFFHNNELIMDLRQCLAQWKFNDWLKLSFWLEHDQ